LDGDEVLVEFDIIAEFPKDLEISKGFILGFSQYLPNGKGKQIIDI
jgi:hypothetical protein